MTNWNDKLSGIDRLVSNGHHKQAVQEAGSVLEQMLRDLITRAAPNLSATDQQAVAQAQQDVGKGKAINEFTLGQVVGLLRASKFIELAEKALGCKLPYLSSANFNTFRDLRNRATHAGADVSGEESQFFTAQVRLFAKELGLLKPTAAPLDPGTAVAARGLKPWTELVKLHPDVESDALTEAMFAIDLGAVAANAPDAPPVYRDAEAFFKATYPTSDLRQLLEEVLASLAGKGGYNRVLKLRTHFGGGKSHVLTAMLHAARSRRSLDVVPECQGFADPGSVDVAVFDGEKFGAVEGMTLEGGRSFRTPWGWVAWQFGPEKYALVEQNERDRVSPGGDTIRKLLEGKPKLILLDEVLKYMERAAAVPLLDSTLQRQAMDFVQNLTVEVSGSRSAAMVYSLQWSAREALGNVALLQSIDHLTGRVDQLREPVTGDEILLVLQKRLLGGPPPDEVARAVAEAYSQVIVGMWRAHAETPGAKKEAEEKGLELEQRMRSAYPFHPALIDVMKDRWSSVDDFQRTRGALRFLASCLHSLKKNGGASALLGPAEIPLSDPEVRRNMLKDLDPKQDYYPVLTADIIGPSARAKRIDDRLAKENPALASVKPATRIATAILVYSFGGLRREGGGESETLPPGVTEHELLSSCVGPELDSITASAVLGELKSTCLYLHFDGVRYCFKKDPNVVKLIEDAEQVVARDPDQVQSKIKEMLGQRLAGHPGAILWPTDSRGLPDKEPQFLIGYLPLDVAGRTEAEKIAIAKGILFKHGDGPRKYRNGVGVAMPDRKQVEPLRRAVRYLLAVENVEKQKSTLRLKKDQLDQLKERRRTEEGVAEGALRSLYPEVWLPRIDDGQEAIEKIDWAGRSPQAAGVHERCMELLTSLSRKWVHPTVVPRKIVERVKLGEVTEPGQSPRLGIKVADVVASFYEVLEPPRLDSAEAIRRAIARGVGEGEFGYYGGPVPALGAEEKFEVSRDKVAIDRTLAEDEVDLDSGFVMHPSAVPEPAPQVCPRCGKHPCECAQVCARCGQSPCVCTEPCPRCGKAPCECAAAVCPRCGQHPCVCPQPCPKCGQSPCVCPAGLKAVRIAFKATRDQVYKAFSAIANLADQSEGGQVTVEVRGTNPQGYDQNWLRNAVEEPLDEADIERLDE